MNPSLSSDSPRFAVEGTVLDPLRNESFPARVHVEDGNILEIERINFVTPGRFITPGHINAHEHIESTKLIPAEAARQMAPTGIIATVSDPHEIANVCGMEGIEYMLRESIHASVKICYGAPSCVPATDTSIETAGAEITTSNIETLMENPAIYALAEVMYAHGVVTGDPQLLAKIALAHKAGKRVDGHAPGFTGADLKKYVSYGITSDHECTTYEEAREKAGLGQVIFAREGSAAKNEAAVRQIAREFPDQYAFCTDDSEPHELKEQVHVHMRRMLEEGFDPFVVYRCASVTPVKHYGLPVGLLQVGDPADFLVVNNALAADFEVISTYVNGRKVAHEGQSLLSYVPPADIINNFHAEPVTLESLRIRRLSDCMRVIEIIPGQLITNEMFVTSPKEVHGNIESDVSNDILKLVCVNRYTPHAKPAVAFVNKLGLKRGAVASTVGHDCHNIIAAGCSDLEIMEAINNVIAVKGGVSFVDGHNSQTIPLPIAGLMSDQNSETLIPQYAAIERLARNLGSELPSVYMALSFLALPVIGDLKLTDKGLFKTSIFSHAPVFV